MAHDNLSVEPSEVSVETMLISGGYMWISIG